MNIYQKLKESGIMTDGLSSPLKIDPPKKKAGIIKQEKDKTVDGGWKPEVTVSAPRKESLFSKIGHTALDLAGLVPGFGEVADGANSLWYLAQGDKKNAALSAAAMIPFAGWGATGAKLGMKASKAAKLGAKANKSIKDKKIISKVEKELFESDLKQKPDMFYRGIGPGGLDDFKKAGVLRARPGNTIPAEMIGGFDISKRFDAKKHIKQKLYASPDLSKVDGEYAKGVIAEIPKLAPEKPFSQRYKGSDWSQYTTSEIPRNKVNVYKKNNFGAYKIIE